MGKTKKPKEEKKKQHLLQNVLFVLREWFRTSPALVLLDFFNEAVISGVSTYVQNILFLKSLMEVIEGRGEFAVFMQRVLFIVAFKTAVELLLWWTSATVNHSIVIKFEKRLNLRIFQKASEVEIANYENPEFFDKFHRATKVVEENEAFQIIGCAGWLLSSLSDIAAMGVYIATVDLRILLVALCPLMMLLISFRENKLKRDLKSAKTPNDRQKDYVKRTVFLKEFAKDIKTSGIFEVLKKRFSDAVARNRELIRKYGWRIAILEMFMDFFGSVVPFVGGYAYSAYRFMYTEGFLLSDFSVLVSAITTFKNRLENAGNAITALQEAGLYVEYLREFLEYEPTLKGGQLHPGAFESLEFRDVSFHYPGKEEHSLQHISFTMHKGEKLAVVGENGAGKTTFVKLLLRLYDPSEGDIFYNGINIREYNLEEYRRVFASVFQDYRVFAMSVAENVLMQELQEAQKPSVVHALKQSGAYGKVADLPQSIDTHLTREFKDTGASLSGGEGQKVAISRIFAKEFEIAVLDEPSSALDPIAEDHMYQSLMAQTQKKSVVYISHRLSSTVRVDTILVLAAGTLCQCGSHGDLMAQDGIYAEMFRLQSSGYLEKEAAHEA